MKKYTVAKRSIKIADKLFIVLGLIFISSSFAIAYGAYNDGLLQVIGEAMTEDDEPYSPPAMTCDKKFYKARWDCRKKLVDNHYEVWQEKKETIKMYCDAIATDMYCENI